MLLVNDDDFLLLKLLFAIFIVDEVGAKAEAGGAVDDVKDALGTVGEAVAAGSFAAATAAIMVRAEEVEDAHDDDDDDDDDDNDEGDGEDVIAIVVDVL